MSSNNASDPFGQFVDVDSELGTFDPARDDELSKGQQQEQLAKVQKATAENEEKQKQLKKAQQQAVLTTVRSPGSESHAEESTTSSTSNVSSITQSVVDKATRELNTSLDAYRKAIEERVNKTDAVIKKIEQINNETIQQPTNDNEQGNEMNDEEDVDLSYIDGIILETVNDLFASQDTNLQSINEQNRNIPSSSDDELVTNMNKFIGTLVDNLYVDPNNARAYVLYDDLLLPPPNTGLRVPFNTGLFAGEDDIIVSQGEDYPSGAMNIAQDAAPAAEATVAEATVAATTAAAVAANNPFPRNESYGTYDSRGAQGDEEYGNDEDDQSADSSTLGGSGHSVTSGKSKKRSRGLYSSTGQHTGIGTASELSSEGDSSPSGKPNKKPVPALTLTTSPLRQITGKKGREQAATSSGTATLMSLSIQKGRIQTVNSTGHVASFLHETKTTSKEVSVVSSVGLTAATGESEYSQGFINELLKSTNNMLSNDPKASLTYILTRILGQSQIAKIGAKNMRDFMAGYLTTEGQIAAVWGKNLADSVKNELCYQCGQRIKRGFSPDMEHLIPNNYLYTIVPNIEDIGIWNDNVLKEIYVDGTTNTLNVYKDMWLPFIQKRTNLSLLQTAYNNINTRDVTISIDDTLNNLLELFKEQGIKDYLRTNSQIKPNIQGSEGLLNRVMQFIGQNYLTPTFFPVLKCYLIEFKYSHSFCNQMKFSLLFCTPVQPSQISQTNPAPYTINDELITNYAECMNATLECLDLDNQTNTTNSVSIANMTSLESFSTYWNGQPNINTFQHLFEGTGTNPNLYRINNNAGRVSLVFGQNGSTIKGRSAKDVYRGQGGGNLRQDIYAATGIDQQALLSNSTNRVIYFTRLMQRQVTAFLNSLASYRYVAPVANEQILDIGYKKLTSRRIVYKRKQLPSIYKTIISNLKHFNTLIQVNKRFISKMTFGESIQKENKTRTDNQHYFGKCAKIVSTVKALLFNINTQNIRTNLYETTFSYKDGAGLRQSFAKLIYDNCIDTDTINRIEFEEYHRQICLNHLNLNSVRFIQYRQQEITADENGNIVTNYSNENKQIQGEDVTTIFYNEMTAKIQYLRNKHDGIPRKSRGYEKNMLEIITNMYLDYICENQIYISATKSQASIFQIDNEQSTKYRNIYIEESTREIEVTDEVEITKEPIITVDSETEEGKEEPQTSEIINIRGLTFNPFVYRVLCTFVQKFSETSNQTVGTVDQITYNEIKRIVIRGSNLVEKFVDGGSFTNLVDDQNIFPQETITLIDNILHSINETIGNVSQGSGSSSSSSSSSSSVSNQPVSPELTYFLKDYYNNNSNTNSDEGLLCYRHLVRFWDSVYPIVFQTQLSLQQQAQQQQQTMDITGGGMHTMDDFSEDDEEDELMEFDLEEIPENTDDVESVRINENIGGSERHSRRRKKYHIHKNSIRARNKMRKSRRLGGSRKFRVTKHKKHTRRMRHHQ
uniref:Uncharacterized protein n=1 Tax=viral metagenome TaxID=1070528 RepID=A0A6C0FD19_9ZZZZ